MRLFWRRRKAGALSAAISHAQYVLPSTTTTAPVKFAGSYASGATVTFSEPPMTTPTYSCGPWSIYDDPPQGRSWTTNKIEVTPVTTRPYDSVSVEAIAADDAAAAVVRYQGLEAYGSSKRNKHERKNADTGLDIAIGRAFVNLGRKMEKRGLNRIGD